MGTFNPVIPVVLVPPRGRRELRAAAEPGSSNRGRLGSLSALALCKPHSFRWELQVGFRTQDTEVNVSYAGRRACLSVG